MPENSRSNFSFQEYIYLLKQDLTAFMQRSFLALHPGTPFFDADYHDVMMSALADCFAGKTKRLIINAPPRGIKSHATSVSFPAWALARNPSLKFIVASYSMDLAETLARETRTLMEHQFYKAMTMTRISNKRKALHDFYTTQGGFRMATSPDGTLTGRGCDFFIIDDPMKADEALSAAARKSRIEWYENTVISRLNSKKDGVIILVMQRLHQNDLCGHLLAQGGWRHLSFPAIAQADIHIPYSGPYGPRIFRRAVGELLHPEREDQEALDRIRDETSLYNFSSQYLQNPIPEAGYLIHRDWLKFYAVLPNGRPLSTVQSWDTANKSTEISDYSVCTTWQKRAEDFYLIDVFRKRLEFPDLRRAIIAQAQKYSPDTVLIEDRASGTQLIQDLAREVRGIAPYLPPAGADKTMRLHACSHLFDAGRIFLPEKAPWLDVYIAELLGFPGTAHDDQVDSTTQALDYMKTPDELEIYRRLAAQIKNEQS